MTHAQKRFHQRYGINLDKRLYSKITRWIRNGSPRVEFVRKQFGNRAIYTVQIKQQIIPVVVCNYGSIIITALPKEAI